MVPKHQPDINHHLHDLHRHFLPAGQLVKFMPMCEHESFLNFVKSPVTLSSINPSSQISDISTSTAPIRAGPCSYQHIDDFRKSTTSLAMGRILKKTYRNTAVVRGINIYPLVISHSYGIDSPLSLMI